MRPGIARCHGTPVSEAKAKGFILCFDMKGSDVRITIFLLNAMLKNRQKNVCNTENLVCLFFLLLLQKYK